MSRPDESPERGAEGTKRRSAERERRSAERGRVWGGASSEDVVLQKKN